MKEVGLRGFVRNSMLALLAAGFAAAFLYAGDAQAHRRHAHRCKHSTRTATVTITSSGFVPQTLSILVCTTVIWQDVDDTETHVIASNPYPSDTSLPSLRSPQMGQGTSYSYTFTKVGTVYYHDDLHPLLNGTILVSRRSAG